MKILVCGGRDYQDAPKMCAVLDAIDDGKHQITHVIHGGARGADTMAGFWARSVGSQEVICPPNWDYYDKLAGPIRNEAMLWLNPDLVIAFPGGKGTANMVQAAKDKGIEVREIT